jgi:hypothetical protein
MSPTEPDEPDMLRRLRLAMFIARSCPSGALAVQWTTIIRDGLERV